jgi:hypothetical protein
MWKQNSKSSVVTNSNTVEGAFFGELPDETVPPPVTLHLVPRGSVQQKIAIFENRANDRNYFTEEQYDLTPVAKPASTHVTYPTSPPAFTIDPFERSPVDDDEGEESPLSPTR